MAREADGAARGGAGGATAGGSRAASRDISVAAGEHRSGGSNTVGRSSPRTAAAERRAAGPAVHGFPARPAFATIGADARPRQEVVGA
jgi:hypothetical protein